MGIRYRKSINFGPLRLNISKSGVGYSFGFPGFRQSKSASGRERKTISLPGTGLSYVKESGSKKNNNVREKKLDDKYESLDGIFSDGKEITIDYDDVLNYVKKKGFVTTGNLTTKFNISTKYAKEMLEKLKKDEIVVSDDEIIYKLI